MLTNVVKNVEILTHTHGSSRNNLDLVSMPKINIYIASYAVFA